MKRARPCTVATSGDRITIQTNARRAEAILLVLSGCTLQEVGDRFGITRERVRQYLKDAGIATGERERFRDRPTVRERKTLSAAHVRRERFEERQIRIRNAVLIIQMFKSEHGRPPTHKELQHKIFGDRRADSWAAHSVAQWLGRTTANGKSTSRTLHALYRLAGCDGKRRGCWTGRSWINRTRLPVASPSHPGAV